MTAAAWQAWLLHLLNREACMAAHVQTHSLLTAQLTPCKAAACSQSLAANAACITGEQRSMQWRIVQAVLEANLNVLPVAVRGGSGIGG